MFIGVHIIISNTRMVGHSNLYEDLPLLCVGLYDPAMMSYGVLKKLCNAESVCAICICKDEVTDALLVPVSYWLHGTKVSNPTCACLLLAARHQSE